MRPVLDCECKEFVDAAFSSLNGNGISAYISVTNINYVTNYQYLQGLGMSKTLNLTVLVVLWTIVLQRLFQSSLVIHGDL